MTPNPEEIGRSTRRPKRRVRLILTIVLVLAAGGIAWWLHARGAGKSAAPTPPLLLQVGVQTVAMGKMDIFLDGLGTVTPLANVTIQTQISGQLVEVDFKEGQMVRKGDLLAVIDPRPYQVALDQSEAQLLQAQAQLKEAQLDKARYEKLSLQDSIATQQLDQQNALVLQYEGLVKADQAAIASANLNLAYCHITAPVGGRVGLRQVDLGNYVMPNLANGLVVLTQVKPITVIFTLPEQYIPRVAARLRAGTAIAVDAYDQAQANKLASGTLAAIDNQVDTTTGTFRLRAVFPNDDESLFPNQFVNTRMLLDVDQRVIVIPNSGIERNQQGTFVYVVKANDTVAMRPVTLGPTEDSRVEVSSGLAPGDRVVVDGADEIREGMKVAVQMAQ
jgi:membrane fusion protein, multidrug efflux system